jgi:hypothetical protein
MAVTMTFDGWAFSAANFTATSITLDIQEPANPQKSVGVDGSAVPEATASGASIRISGQIAGSSESDLSDNIQALLRNTTGNNRSNKGRLSVRSGYHYWCARQGGLSFDRPPGQYQASLSMSFFSQEPWMRAATLIQLSKASSSSFTIAYGSGGDFDGDARRMPLRINAGGGWSQGETFYIENTTAGWSFSKTLVSTLASGEDLVIDSEQGTCWEGERISNARVNGQFPYILGGSTNTLDASSSDNTPTLNVDFWDRYSPVV